MIENLRAEIKKLEVKREALAEQVKQAEHRAKNLFEQVVDKMAEGEKTQELNKELSGVKEWLPVQKAALIRIDKRIKQANIDLHVALKVKEANQPGDQAQMKTPECIEALKGK